MSDPKYVLIRDTLCGPEVEERDVDGNVVLYDSFKDAYVAKLETLAGWYSMVALNLERGDIKTVSEAERDIEMHLSEISIEEAFEYSLKPGEISGFTIEVGFHFDMQGNLAGRKRPAA